MSLGFRMHAERTPNPNSVKWVLGQVVVESGQGYGSVSFEDSPAADVSPLVSRLFEVEGVVSVLLGPDFITLSKRPELEWTDLAPPIVAHIKAWAAEGTPALGEAWEPPEVADQGEVVARIRKIIDEDVQPYVAMDGGEITLAGFRDGVVEVYLRGACEGCPSSTITLKVGIEARLKEQVPEVQSVVAL
jgi:Fe-S cluster biogenesis protein NfuA